MMYRSVPTFISTTRNKNLRVNVEISVELVAIELLDRLAQTRTPSRMGVVVWSYGIESFFCGSYDPFRRRKVHITLTEVQAV